MIHTLMQDLRFALRTLGRRPGFTAVAVLTLSLGIGANAAIFSLVRGVVLAPLPYAEPERLVEVLTRWTGVEDSWLNELEFFTLAEESRALEHVAALYPLDVNLTGGDEPLRVPAAAVSAGMFAVLGVEPALGRPFTAAEDRPGAEPVVLLSHELWRGRFGGDREILGRMVEVDGAARRVVGVLPPDTRLPRDLVTGSRTEIWAPLGLDRAAARGAGGHYLFALARLAPGTSRRAAQVGVDALVERLKAEHAYSGATATFGIDLVPLEERVVGDFKTALLVLAAAVGCVLLIACANLANLLLARSQGRRREIALRAALGAGRSRLIRQLLTESVTLALLGAGGALLLAVWGLQLARTLDPGNLPRLSDVELDAAAVVFTAVLVVATGLLFGILPALQATRRDPRASLRPGDRSGGPERGPLRHALVVGQVAATAGLLVAAGLLLRSFQNLSGVDAGFSERSVLSFEIALPETSYPEGSEVAAFARRLRQRLVALPGVEAAGAVTTLPLTGARGDWGFRIEGRPIAPGEPWPVGDWQVVTPGYFEALRIDLLEGRLFAPHEGWDSPPVAIVNRSLARRYWPEGGAVGRRIQLGGGQGHPWVTVVGVVADVRHRGLDAPARRELYLPHGQWDTATGRGTLRSLTWVARAAGDPLALADPARAEIAALDPRLPIARLRTLEEVRSDALAQPRFAMVLMGLFAVVALLLAAVGILGVLSFLVARRTREIGIRIALGARPEGVLARVLRQGVGLAVGGLVLGLLAALAFGRALGSLLHGVPPADPATFASVSLLLLAVAALASYLPARRAARVDPLQALRYE